MRITLASGTPAELVRPDGVEPTRGLVVIPDVAGLRPLFDDIVARLAHDHGWVVCAPELWPDHADVAVPERLQRVTELDTARVLADAAAAADACTVEPVGLIGFCMGGMFAFLSAATGRYDRVCAFYGMIRPPQEWRSERLGDPLAAVAADGASPVLAIIGDIDPYTPPADVADLDAVPGVTVRRYPAAEHGFVHDPARPSHRADDAADAWSAMARFLTTGTPD